MSPLRWVGVGKQVGAAEGLWSIRKFLLMWLLTSNIWYRQSKVPVSQTKRETLGFMLGEMAEATCMPPSVIPSVATV